MWLVDTSAWIEWLIGSPTGERIAPLLPLREEWLVPTMVQFELAKWITREIGEDKSDQVIAFTTTCRVAPLDTTIALAAADLAARHRLSAGDAIILATARAHDADLLTADAHFAGLPRVTYLAKTPA